MNNTIVKNKVTSHAFKILIAFLFTILIALSSKISVPFYPVPMTMQTFVVLFTGVTALEAGMSIGVGVVDNAPGGVDTQEDLDAVRERWTQSA